MSELLFVSSRAKSSAAKLTQALLSPLASDGGLFCPSEFKPFSNALELANLSFGEQAKMILHQLGLGAYEKAFMRSLAVYEEFDGAKAIEFKQIDNKTLIELWHGKTRAFKDLALAPLARFISEISSEQKLLICCATSGDTGPATLSAFNERAHLVCIYPEGKTSAAQRAQMIKQRYQNALVLGISGNFDDAQSALKELLNDEEFKQALRAKNLQLGAANSLNFGRILYQLIYHFHAALCAAKSGCKRYKILIPSGNFGNALAAFYAKCLGAPIDEICVICNENRILHDFFTTARFDLRNREFFSSASPAMDILKPSNLERLIFHFCGAKFCAQCFENLAQQGYFELNDEQMRPIREIFSSHFCTDKSALATIKKTFDSTKELIDPHTACALAFAKDGDFIASTAEWTKFAPTMIKALNLNCTELDFIRANAPSSSICALLEREEENAVFCHASQIKERILEWLSSSQRD